MGVTELQGYKSAIFEVCNKTPLSLFKLSTPIIFLPNDLFNRFLRHRFFNNNIRRKTSFLYFTLPFSFMSFFLVVSKKCNSFDMYVNNRNCLYNFFFSFTVFVSKKYSGFYYISQFTKACYKSDKQDYMQFMSIALKI